MRLVGAPALSSLDRKAVQQVKGPINPVSPMSFFCSCASLEGEGTEVSMASNRAQGMVHVWGCTQGYLQASCQSLNMLLK